VPSRYPTIQPAINAAVDGDTIIVAPGTYIGEGNRDIDFLSKAITVRSTDPNDPNIVAATIIDCNGSKEDLHRGFYFHSGEGQNSVLDGFTITNGCAYKGGAIWCRYSSSPTIINCIIRGNTSPYEYVPDPFLPIVILQDGGGIYCFESSPIIKKCYFIENTATAGGGAIFSGDGNAIVDNCVIQSNRAGISGGAIELFGDNMSIHNCIITGNSAGYVYHISGGGGAIYCGGFYDSTPTISNCTIIGNRTDCYGGGILRVDRSYITVSNSVIWDNYAQKGREVALMYGGFGQSSITISNSDIRDGSMGVYIQSGCTLNWGLGNINSDPCFIEPGYWSDANDPNIIIEPNNPNSVWLDGDYHLLSNSPCINTGDPNYVPEPNETDLDGLLRVIGGRIDMGAYEFNHQPIAVAGPNQTIYAWINGFANINLDGSASYDDDNDVLDYYWSWTIDGNIYEDNGINPTIKLPVGIHTIELVVDDGIDLSQPSYCTITVIKAIRGRLMLSPNVLQTKSRGKWLIATLFIPPVPGEKVNTTVPLRLYPSGIEAKYQYFSKNRRFCCAPTFAIAFFDKQQLIDALGPGRFEVNAVGEFLSGRFFFGSDIIRIISPPLPPPHHWY
jgi:predicted outer membrane repeat protein